MQLDEAQLPIRRQAKITGRECGWQVGRDEHCGRGQRSADTSPAFFGKHRDSSDHDTKGVSHGQGGPDRDPTSPGKEKGEPGKTLAPDRVQLTGHR